MQTDIHIQWANPDDSQAIAEIHISSWRVAYSDIVPPSVLEGLSVEKRALRHRTRITEEPERIAVAEIAGRVVGFSAFEDSSDDDKPKECTGEICAIYVASSHWRKGIGSRLLHWSEAQLSRRGKREIILWVLEANAPSRRFYEASGYVQDGARKELTIGKPLMALRYAKSHQLVQ